MQRRGAVCASEEARPAGAGWARGRDHHREREREREKGKETKTNGQKTKRTTAKSVP